MAAKSLISNYEGLNNYQKAFDYAKILIKLNKESTAKTPPNAMIRMSVEYQTEKVESENALLLQKEKL